jgi:hypothetical protein
MKEIQENTNTVEDFISECLNQDLEYEDIFEYLKTQHKG